ncbi:MAG: DUF3822 family protein [Bacteroidales bacterium]|nr:DUF3822 family protein [Bacteroidales bacterium]
MINNCKDKISIQVGLSGYSFKVESDGVVASSGWLSADRVFSSPELQKRYDKVDISVFSPKFTLVPAQFFSPAAARQLLSEVVSVSEADHVEYAEVPELASVLVYSNSIGETLSKVLSETVLHADGIKAKPLPEVWYMLSDLKKVTEYNKILASYKDGYLYLVIAQGKTLLLCNSFQAPDFTTAEYFIFLAMKKLQLNPEISSICFRTSLEEEQELSLYRYFRSVEKL